MAPLLPLSTPSMLAMSWLGTNTANHPHPACSTTNCKYLLHAFLTSLACMVNSSACIKSCMWGKTSHN